MTEEQYFEEGYKKGYEEGKQLSVDALRTEYEKGRADAIDEGYKKGYEDCKKAYAEGREPGYTPTIIEKTYDAGLTDGGRKMLDKACEWLKGDLVDDFIDFEPYVVSSTADSLEQFINDFKKAMEE